MEPGEEKDIDTVNSGEEENETHEEVSFSL